MPDSQDARFTEGSVASVRMTLTVTRYHQQLLELAGILINEEQRHRYSLAVIVAHMACEMAVERVVAEVTAGVSRSPKMHGYNLGNETNLTIYTRLTGDEIQNRTSFWGKFEKSANRRNNIVHNRLIPSPEEAAESLVATTALIRYLEHRFGIG